MAGCRAMWTMPVTARVANHKIMTGPNTLPMAFEPCRCSTNNPTSTAIETGTMKGSSFGATISRPSIAPSTEIAGVITLSP